MHKQPRDEGAPLQEEDVQGLKYFRKLWPLLARLHEVGCQGDKAGNRQLFMDQYCALVLLFLFNPCVRSLRALQQASQLKNVQRKLRCGRASLGSLSEATDVFDPERLRAIIGELAAEVKPMRPVGGPNLDRVLTAVDGSMVKALSTIAQAAYLKNVHGQSKSGWRLHTHFDVDRGVPTRIDVTSGRNSGKTDEKNVLRKNLQPDHCYVMDHWYAQFALLNDITLRPEQLRLPGAGQQPLRRARSAALVCGSAGRRRAERRGRGAGDRQRRRQAARSPGAAGPSPHDAVATARQGAGRQAGPPSDGVLRIATDLLDVPAEVIAEIYRQRWSIGLFFRFFKHVLGCQHLLSTSRAGIEIQTYCAIIACLLLALWTGGRPTLRTHEMVCLYLQGWADEEELLAHLQTLKPQVA